MKTINFFQNGNTCAFIDSKQVPELGESWFMLYIKHMIEQGYDPMEFEYILPTGLKANLIKLEDGKYNWEF
jgi:hypothetical protein